MNDIEMPLNAFGHRRNAYDNSRIRQKLLLYILPKLVETDDFEANFINTGNWVFAQQAVSSFFYDLDYGTTRNTFQAFFFLGAVFLGGKLGTYAGKSLGNLYSSVAGKVGGILFGMLFGTVCGSILDNFVSRTADEFDYDIEVQKCRECRWPYVHRRYQLGIAYYCSDCHPQPVPLF